MKTNEMNSEVQADVVSASAKKTGKGTVIAAAAAVVIGGAGIACATVPAVRNAVRMAIMKPDDYCAYVYQNMIDIVDDQAVKRSEASEANTSDVTFELEFADDTARSFKSIYGEGFCRKLTANGHVTVVDGRTQSDFAIDADGRPVLDLDLAVGDEKGYFKIDKLSDKYVEYDIKGQAVSTAAQASASLDAKETSEIVNLYGGLIVEFVGDAPASIEKNVSGKLENISYKYNKITSDIKEDDIKEFIGRLADALENSEASKKASGLDEESYAEMLEDLRGSADDVEGDATLCTYVDPNGIIRGLEWEQDDHPLTIMTASWNESFALDLDSDGLSITVTGRENSGVYSGEADISTDDESQDVTRVNFEDLTVIDDKYLSGKISCDTEELTGGSIGRMELLFEAEDGAQVVSSEIAGVGKIRASVKTENVKGAEVKFPSGSECTDMETFLQTADFDKFFSDLLISLGADEQYGPGGLLGAIMGLSGSSF